MACQPLSAWGMPSSSDSACSGIIFKAQHQYLSWQCARHADWAASMTKWYEAGLTASAVSCGAATSEC